VARRLDRARRGLGSPKSRPGDKPLLIQ
jgi:hypothetical protein